MSTTQQEREQVRSVVPYTFEESLLNWADVLDDEVTGATERSPRGRVTLSAANARAIAAHLRGAARLLETEARL